MKRNSQIRELKDRLYKLKIRRYIRKDSEKAKEEIGVIAEELEGIFPELVKTVKNYDLDGKSLVEYK